MNAIASVDDLLALFDEPFIDQLYRSLLGREPDTAGKLEHLAHLRRGRSKEALIAEFARSTEGLARAAPVAGLAELFAHVDTTASGGAAARWLAGRARPAGLALASDMAAMANQLGRQGQQTRQAVDGKLRAVSDTMAHELQSLRDGVDAMKAQTSGHVQQTAAQHGRLLQLDQTMARLETRMAQFEQQIERFERQVMAPERRRFAEIDGSVKALHEAVERLDQRIALQTTADLGKVQPGWPSVDPQAVQRVRQRLGGDGEPG